MYGKNYSGGGNKTNGQIERADRIDSFEAGGQEASGILLASRNGGSSPTPLWYGRHTIYDPERREIVELSYRGSQWRDTLGLTRVRSGFGGNRAFWLCPICGQRARFLYFKGRRFVCRKCGRLNYRSQQRTKDSSNHFQDGMRLATEKLHWYPPVDIVPMDFPHVTPDRPKGMHWVTYKRHIASFRQYQVKYQRDSLREMLSCLRR